MRSTARGLFQIVELQHALGGNLGALRQRDLDRNQLQRVRTITAARTRF